MAYHSLNKWKKVRESFIKILGKQEGRMKKNLILFLCLFIVFFFNRNYYAASYYPGKALKKHVRF